MLAKGLDHKCADGREGEPGRGGLLDAGRAARPNAAGTAASDAAVLQSDGQIPKHTVAMCFLRFPDFVTRALSSEAFLFCISDVVWCVRPAPFVSTVVQYFFIFQLLCPILRFGSNAPLLLENKEFLLHGGFRPF